MSVSAGGQEAVGVISPRRLCVEESLASGLVQLLCFPGRGNQAVCVNLCLALQGVTRERGTFTGCVCPGQWAQVSHLFGSPWALFQIRWATSKPQERDPCYGSREDTFQVSRTLAPEMSMYIQNFSGFHRRASPLPLPWVCCHSGLLGITQDVHCPLLGLSVGAPAASRWSDLFAAISWLEARGWWQGWREEGTKVQPCALRHSRECPSGDYAQSSRKPKWVPFQTWGLIDTSRNFQGRG